MTKSPYYNKGYHEGQLSGIGYTRRNYEDTLYFYTHENLINTINIELKASIEFEELFEHKKPTKKELNLYIEGFIQGFLDEIRRIPI